MSETETVTRGRVLCVTSNFPRWKNDSTTPFVFHLARDLQDLGWRVDVLAPHTRGAKTREHLDGVQIERFRYLWPASLETVCYGGGALVNLRKNRLNFVKLPPLVFFEWAGIARRLAARRYDILHSHWILPQGFTGVLAARPLRIPHVVTVHGSDVFALRGGFLTRFKRTALRGAEAITVNSSATRKAVEAIAPRSEKIHLIPMGVTESQPDRELVARLRQRHRRGDGPLLVFVGRLVYEKGADDLIRAVAILAEGQPDATALVIGEGQDRGQLESLAQDLGAEKRIVFTGWVQPNEICSYLSAADIFVGPSKRAPDGVTEAQGLTFVEAMQTGTPVIATNIGGIGDAVRHEETGLVVGEAAPVEIAAAIERLIDDPGLVDRLTTAGRALARARFTRHASATAFSGLFLNFLTASQRNVR